MTDPRDIAPPARPATVRKSLTVAPTPEQSSAVARPRNRRWTPADERHLATGVAAGLSWAAIAARLDRTPESCRIRWQARHRAATPPPRPTLRARLRAAWLALRGR